MFNEPPYAERHVRWCERSGRELIPRLLLDFCNKPSVLYSNNNICVKSGRGVLNTPTLTNIQLKSRKDDMIVEDNIYGSKLIEEKINSTKQRIILNSIEEGVYLYKINNCDAVVNRGKLILTK